MADKYRIERIERLLKELRYEVERGILGRELESEHMQFTFIVPRSETMPLGVVWCEFRMRPVGRYDAFCPEASDKPIWRA